MSNYLDKPPEEALERICEAHWNHGVKGDPANGVVFLDVVQHDACNHTLSGTVDIGGVIHGFIICNGNWNGTTVDAWGDPEDVGIYDPGPPQEPLTFIPNDDGLFFERPAVFGVYVAWRKEPWFQEMERDYLYDRHFQPGGKIEAHYREKAAKRGLKVGLRSNLPAAAIEAHPELRWSAA